MEITIVNMSKAWKAFDKWVAEKEGDLDPPSVHDDSEINKDSTLILDSLYAKKVLTSHNIERLVKSDAKRKKYELSILKLKNNLKKLLMDFNSELNVEIPDFILSAKVSKIKLFIDNLNKNDHNHRIIVRAFNKSLLESIKSRRKRYPNRYEDIEKKVRNLGFLKPIKEPKSTK